MVKFTVYGEPVGKGRPRVSLRKMRGADGKERTFSQAYTPKETVTYENLVKTEYGAQCKNFMFPEDAMLDMRVIAYYSIPKSMTKKKRELIKQRLLRPTKKPDLDNVLKCVADSLNKIAYRDDSQIVDCQCRKFYSENPRVEVQIRILNYKNLAGGMEE